MIEYTPSVSDLTAAQLRGFFVGWPHPPSPETHLLILRGSYRVVLARDTGTGHVVGFINAISDGLHAAYIPLLEVLPAYQKRGIGGELVKRMLDELDGLYMIDLVCDPELESFYARCGLRRGFAMVRRDFARQAGPPE